MKSTKQWCNAKCIGVMGKIRNTLKKSKPLIAVYQKFIKIRSKIRLLYMKLFAKVLTEDDLIAQFPDLGLNPGDVIVVNSSMTKIGLLENGPATIVNALKRYVGPDGLIVMPAYPHRGMYEYLENVKLFDVRQTPSKNGAITEYFRKSEGVVRSAHPTHSVAAWGKDAEKIVAGHENCKTPYAKGSPYDKLINMGAKNFLIGVNFDHMILFRAFDDLGQNNKINTYVPNKIYHVPVKLANGREIMVDTPCHDPQFFSAERWNMRLFPYMKEYITFGHLGSAETWVLDSKEMFRIQQECADNDIYPFYHYRFKQEYEQV